MLKLAVATLLLSTLGPASSYERVLIPLFLPDAQPGAQDTRWRTDLTIRNTGDEDVAIFQGGCEYDCSCVILVPCTPGEPTRPGHRFSGRLYGDNLIVPGILIYVERATAANVAMNLRLKELTRKDHAGIEVPIVREDEVRSGPFSIVGIPTRLDYRHHARIYVTSSPSGEAYVRVTAIRELDGTRFYDEVHRVHAPVGEGTIPVAEDPGAAYPGYLFLPIAAPRGLSETTFVLHVTPLTPGITMWGMVSVTHNESQLVTIMTPQ